MADQIENTSIPSEADVDRLAGELDRLLRDCEAAEEQLQSGAVPVAALSEANAALTHIELTARQHLSALSAAVGLLEG